MLLRRPLTEGIPPPRRHGCYWRRVTSQQQDKVGLDVVLDIEEHYAAVRPGIPAEPRQLLKRYVEQGHLGIKSGKGFYSDYEEKAPTR